MARYKKASDIRVGVVGYGGAFNMGRQHLLEMRQAGMTPAAVAEIDPKRLDAAEKDFPGIETYPSLGELLKKSRTDLLAILTPHDSHARLAIQALKAGRHVVCEKPLALTTAECDAMIAQAKRAKAVISTYHNRHWDGHILNAVKHVRSGLIGDVARVEAHMSNYGRPGDWWRTSKSISGGILYDWGVHLLEYSLQLIDSGMTEVCGLAHRGYWAPQTKWRHDCNEDEGFAVVRFASGAWLSLLISNIDSNPRRGLLEITGTKGSYAVDWSFNEATTHAGGNIVVTKYRNPPGEGWRFYQNIADHLVKGERLIITGEWARRPIHILDLAGKSANLKRAVKTRYA